MGKLGYGSATKATGEDIIGNDIVKKQETVKQFLHRFLFFSLNRTNSPAE